MTVRSLATSRPADRPSGASLQLQLLRRSRTVSLVVASLALSAALAFPIGAAARDRRGPACTTKTAKTLLATRQARVFNKRGRIYACLKRGRKSFQIGTRASFAGNNMRNLRLAGRYVAYSNSLNRVKLTVRELRKGRIIHDETAAQPTRPTLSFLTDVKLKRTGSLAWIVKLTPLDAPLNPYPTPADTQPDYQVLKADRAGRALLDSGIDIEPGSLRLSGTTVSWTKAGSTRSAALN